MPTSPLYLADKNPHVSPVWEYIKETLEASRRSCTLTAGALEYAPDQRALFASNAAFSQMLLDRLEKEVKGDQPQEEE
jgi:hypothetical protein